MAVNFKIYRLRSQSKNSVRLALDGDFDGTSAHELINALAACEQGVDQVVIDTSGLKAIHPFGQAVLQRNLSDLRLRCPKLVFFGDHGRRLSRPWLQ
ncbi:hypothetical protein DSCW_29120 [Desulfosarcina widdelii]|uniref:STAS domain-containing protein n=1 Tax=Desulfosarcina widdelii TaxID=947919 RepID=A0A5K7Z438_9BACT|nr:STAS domain-containing protein [Desulfosarcina widdelii]BBO75495.1 hypothetical protein DSCW_29120 [Desulfosarcina widdelii]